MKAKKLVRNLEIKLLALYTVDWVNKRGYHAGFHLVLLTFLNVYVYYYNMSTLDTWQDLVGQAEVLK